ncbi:hypothetical protein RVR_10571 [Actinacidiphila reveromycinica]|uniref:Uncharacterized protein n=1 Tax=Actinacidiphila reveromycinica TaxID=659352 RepID=A0A7U3VRE6_9ACTN|nr:hypothetical protein [Streptomyces sp. SN-593]BBB00572.1 hypothetical protein RVR_7702 [Streptomyces sp. SN-593]BBB00625.1 hypothetical protein RVR_10571 [Streptomyces sp. SN-593]
MATTLDPTQAHRVELPGGWADLRPVSDITERMRRPIKRLSAKLTSFPEFMNAVQAGNAATADGSEMTQAQQLALAASMGDAFDVLEELQDALVVAVTRGWSWDFAVTVDGVLDLPGPALDALRQAVAPYQNALNPNFDPTPAPGSPTGPSSD